MATVGNKPTLHTSPTTPPTASAPLSPQVGKALQDGGLVKPGKTPADAAKALLGGLKDAGFQAPPQAGKELGAQLAGALKGFQQARGLPPTGRVDGATAEALKNLGAPPEPTATERASKDGFERAAPSLLKQGEQQRADAMKSGSPDTNFLDALLNKLGGDHGVTADRKGYVGGTAEAATNAAKTDAAGEAKRVNEAEQKSGSTADAQKSAREDSAQQLDRAKESKVQVARGLKAEQTRTEEQRRKDALFGKNPTERGILDDEADDDDAGEGGDGKQRGRGGDQQAGAHGDGSDTAGGSDARDGNERRRGNAQSGSGDDGDPSRGVASIDDGSGVDADHYRVSTLSEQAFAALGKIQKDPQDGLRATTYSWDVVFYKPGIYAAGQKAQDLVHLVVMSATAFDPIWQKAQANLQVLVRKLERDGAVPSFDDLVAALRQARARDGGTAAPALGKLRRPPGRA
ncbi:MAG: hypothetical protein FJ137_14330 [Deltaproteobacteria bacterium]|nr:hypothetical protein [Deltaproteobacteria bacterium]